MKNLVLLVLAVVIGCAGNGAGTTDPGGNPAPTPGNPAPTPGNPAPTPGNPAPTPGSGPCDPAGSCLSFCGGFFGPTVRDPKDPGDIFDGLIPGSASVFVVFRQDDGGRPVAVVYRLTDRSWEGIGSVFLSSQEMTTGQKGMLGAAERYLRLGPGTLSMREWYGQLGDVWGVTELFSVPGGATYFCGTT